MTLRFATRITSSRLFRICIFALFALVAASAGFSYSASAEEMYLKVMSQPTPPQKAPTTWEECVQWAAVNSPEIKAALTNWKSLHDLTRSLIGAYFPVITATVNYGHTEYDNSNPGGIPEYTDTDSTSALLNLTQNIFNGFGDEERVKQARANEKAALAALQLARAKISSDLKTAFAGLMFARDSVDLTTKIMERRKQNLSLVELRYEGGRENKGSVMLYQAYLKDAAYSRLQAVDLIDSAEAVFGKVIGLDPESVKAVRGTVPKTDPPKNVDFGSLLADNPNHVQGVGVEDAGRANVEIARSRLLPVLAFNASAGKVDTMFFPQNKTWNIGLGLTIPIFNGGKDYYGLRSAQGALYNASANLELADRLLIMNLKQAYYSYIEAIEKEGVDVTYLQAARVRADIGRNKYDNGLLTFEDWDLIETDLINRETSALASSRNRVVQESNWEQSQGKGVFQ